MIANRRTLRPPEIANDVPGSPTADGLAADAGCVTLNSMRSCVRLLALLLLLVPQLPAQSVLKALSAGATSATPRRDPLGRDTPRGTLMGFMEAAQRGNRDRAAEYLQLPRQSSEVDSLRLVDDFKILLDRAFVGRVSAVSDSPELAFDPQLEPNHERAGTFAVNGRELPLLVVRTADGNNGYVWLISWNTLAHCSDLADDTRSHDIERHLPRLFVRLTFLSIPLWVWILFLLLIPLALAVGAVAVWLARTPAWLLRRLHHRAARSEIWINIRGPVLLVATTAAHAIGMRSISVPLLFREYYLKVQGTAVLVAGAWLAWDFITVWTRRTRRTLTEPRDRGTLSLTLLLHRLLKIVVATTALFGVLALVGVNLSAALAGVGLGGIALALAAQKSIENLFGGVSILTDRVIRVGDLCSIGTVTGTVEDIGLRSTRIRTFERGLVAVPNGALATLNIENLSSRDKIRLFTKIGLRYETRREQLEQVLVRIDALLHEHPRVEHETAWIHLARFADSSIELELQAYIRTHELTDFMNVREELLLRIMQILDECGTALAFPSQTLYLARDTAPTPPSPTPK